VNLPTAGLRTIAVIPLLFLIAGFIVHTVVPVHALPAAGLIYIDGREVRGEPVQEAAPGIAIRRGPYTIRALAAFDMHSRVLAMQPYSGDRESALVPVDYVMAWGVMSRADVARQFSIEQKNRWCFWEARHPTVTAEDVITHSANMHLIPATPDVASALRRIRRYDIVHVRGWLVEVSAPDGWTWCSSLSRDDTGNNACEIIYVESVVIE
jgi:hypothetical protein